MPEYTESSTGYQQEQQRLYQQLTDRILGRDSAAAYQMEQEALRQRILVSISVERHNYRARTGNDPRYVILGRREYLALRSSPLMGSPYPADGALIIERIHGLEIIEATRRESFIAVCDNAQA